MIITPLTENGESNTFALSFNYSGNSSENERKYMTKK
jgi:hypothetical protein